MLELLGQAFAHSFTGGMDIDSVNGRIWSRKINIFHGTDSQLSIICIAVIADACIINDDHFTRFDIPYPLSTDYLKGTGFG